MSKLARVFVAVTVIALMMLSLLLTGCGRGPNEKQLQALEETKSAAVAAEGSSAECNSEKADLQKQLAEKQQKLQQLKQEKVDVTNRLSAM
jgi:uncharacterized lipoprotein YmbA